MNIKEFFKEHMNKRRLKDGSFATALTVFVIAAVVLVNVIVTVLFDRFPIRLDLTSGSIYTVSEETAEYIEGVETPVIITVMSTEEEYRAISSYTSQTVELLKNYTQHNPLITVRYIDLLSNPDFVANYTQTLEEGDIVVEPDDGTHARVKIVSLTDLLNVPDDYSYLLSYAQSYGSEYVHTALVAGESSRQIKLTSNAEQAITSAIMTVTDANPVTVAVLKYPGANEADITGLTDLLDVNGYLLTEVDIQSGELSYDVDLAIIPAPKVDYTTQEINKIEKWLEGPTGRLEKDLIYIASAQQPATPNLDGLLYKYGITVEQKMIYETDSARWIGQDTPTYTLQDIVTENYLGDMTNLSRSFFVPDSRALSLRFDNVDSVNSCEPVIASSASSELRDMYALDVSGTERGSFNSVAIGKQKKVNQDDHISTYTNVVVFGSELILDSTVIRNAGFANGDFIISMLNDITGKSGGITITPKSVASDTFEITTAQTRALTLTFALAIPAAVLIVGTAVWIRRRHK